ncbi:MAG: ABC transporter ATP-binding protein [Acidimicrobiales bacterium]
MTAVLQTDHLSLQFGGVNALSDLSIGVDEGALHAIIGPNGAGKTSFFNCLTGYYKPTGGAVRFQGNEVTGLDAAKVAALGIRRTFQNIRVFPKMSVLENVLAGGHLRATSNLLSITVASRGFRRRERLLHDEAMASLEFVGLADQWNNLAGDLPYGMRKRMELARVLIANPVVVLLDEPAAGVSSVEREELSRVIRRIHDQGTCVVMIEHDVDLVMEIATDVTVLDNGRIIASGLPQDVRTNPDVIRAYMGRKRK